MDIVEDVFQMARVEWPPSAQQTSASASGSGAGSALPGSFKVSS